MFDWISQPEAWAALGTLTLLEIVLGIDNVVFISILTGKLPPSQQPKARKLGLLLAMGMRIALLFSLTWMMRLTDPLFTVPILEHEVSGRDLILIVGGLFLLAKSTHEIHQKLEGHEGGTSARVAPSFGSVLIQITLLDIVFSLDSVITAIGMVVKPDSAGSGNQGTEGQIMIMVIAVVVAVMFMMVFSGPVGRFVEKHPTVKILALSFLLLIGMSLIADGTGHHIPKGYIYSAMAFSVFVEIINQRVRPVSQPVHLHEPYTETNTPE